MAKAAADAEAALEQESSRAAAAGELAAARLAGVQEATLHANAAVAAATAAVQLRPQTAAAVAAAETSEAHFARLMLIEYHIHTDIMMSCYTVDMVICC